MHLPELISDLALMLLTAGVVTVVFKKLRQPLVLGYILAGFLIGPYMPWFFTVTDEVSINTWSEIGIIILMFSLGLEFNLHKLGSAAGRGRDGQHFSRRHALNELHHHHHQGL